jgi:hypothetical protein
METKIHTIGNFKRVEDLRKEFLTRIEKFFVDNDLDTVEFRYMFTVYLTAPNQGELTVMEPHVIKALGLGTVLFGQDPVGDDIEINIVNIEQIGELAYILDALEDRAYTVD